MNKYTPTLVSIDSLSPAQREAVGTQARIIRDVERVYGWDVRADSESWYLTWEHGSMQIGSAELPQGIALDAALEFMDRYRENNMPRWVQDPGDLMRFCLGEARKQR